MYSECLFIVLILLIEITVTSVRVLATPSNRVADLVPLNTPKLEIGHTPSLGDCMASQA